MIFVEWQARNMITIVERRAAIVPSRLSDKNAPIVFVFVFVLVSYLPVGRRDGVVDEGGGSY